MIAYPTLLGIDGCGAMTSYQETRLAEYEEFTACIAFSAY